jgi:hydrogenase maturation factor
MAAVEHIPGPDCPACALMIEAHNDLLEILNAGYSHTLGFNDLARVMALLLVSCEESGPTVDAKIAFRQSFVKCLIEAELATPDNPVVHH